MVSSSRVRRWVSLEMIVEEAIGLLFGDIVVAEDFGIGADRGERGPQFMTDRGQEVVLEAIEFLQLGVGAGQFPGGGFELARLLLDLAAVGEDLMGLFEDRHHLVEAEELALGDRGDHAARRGGADAAGEQALDEGDQIGVGFGHVADPLAMFGGIIAKGAARRARYR